MSSGGEGAEGPEGAGGATAAQQWQIDGPKVLDIGGEDERVTKLEVAVVGGRVDVVTHDDSPTARVEITQVEGLPVHVSWDGSRLRITHGKDSDKNIMDMLKRTLETFARNKVTVSISVPVDAAATVSTVTATAVLSGLHSRVKVNTVSGTVTVSDLEGDIDLKTVSGNVEGEDLVGPASVNTVSGSVTIQASALPDVRVNTVSGDIALDLTSGEARIRSNSVSGDVTVRAPLQGFDVEANTASGQVVVDGRQLSRGQRGNEVGGHKSGYKGGRLHEGNGALQVKANAVSGSIVVLRAGATGRADSSGPQDRAGGPSATSADATTRQGSGASTPAPQDAPPADHPADQAAFAVPDEQAGGFDERPSEA